VLYECIIEVANTFIQQTLILKPHPGPNIIFNKGVIDVSMLVNLILGLCISIGIAIVGRILFFFIERREHHRAEDIGG